MPVALCHTSPDHGRFGKPLHAAAIKEDDVRRCDFTLERRANWQIRTKKRQSAQKNKLNKEPFQGPHKFH